MSGFSVYLGECEAYFSSEDDGDGEIGCRASELCALERYCTVSMYRENIGRVLKMDARTVKSRYREVLDLLRMTG